MKCNNIGKPLSLLRYSRSWIVYLYIYKNSRDTVPFFPVETKVKEN